MLLLGGAGPAAAGWITDGPYGGSVRALAVNPQTPATLYTGAEFGGGVFKWTSLFTLTIGKAGSGEGTVTSNPPGVECGTDCREHYAAGTPIALTATPSARSSFTAWSGADCRGTGTCVVTMDQVQSVTATFTLNTYVLSVTKAGSADGTVTSNPLGISCGCDCSESYTHGASVTLTASPGAGASFKEWRGAPRRVPPVT